MRRICLAMAIVCQLAFGTLYLLRTPVFEGPDENDHYYYAIHLAHTKTLPTVIGSHELTGLESWREAGLGHHPPLYYAVVAGCLWLCDSTDLWPRFSMDGVPRDGPCKFRHGFDEIAPVSAEVAVFRMLRALSLLCGVGSLLPTWRIALRIFPRSPGIAEAAALCLACVPQWSFCHAVLDNGCLATLLAHAVLLVLVRAVAEQRLSTRSGVWLGLWLGLGLITKLTVIALVPLAGVVIAYAAFAGRERRGETLRSAVVAGLLVVFVSGWFFLRNHSLYGEWLGMNAHALAYAQSRVPAPLVAEPIEYWWKLVLVPLATSFVANFGWMRVPAPDFVIGMAWIVIAVALAGFVASRLRKQEALRTGPSLFVLLLAIGLVSASVLKFNADYVQPQGRYLFAAAGPMLILFCAGLHAFGVPKVALVLAPLSSGLVLALVFWPRFGLDPSTLDNGYEAVLHGGIRHVGTPAPGLSLLAPEPGTRCSEAPVFRFSIPPAEPLGGGYTIHAWSETGRILFCTFELVGTSLAGEFPFPSGPWQQLPIGETMHWRVRRIPNRAHHERWQDMPQSEVRTLVRIR